jgi:hypothetical protein
LTLEPFDPLQPQVTFTATQALTLLLTTESLLFAAFNVGVALTTPVAGGRNLTRKAAWLLAVSVSLALACVATGAFMAWWQVFVDHWPHSFFGRAEAAVALIGILVQPVVSLAASYGIKP